MRLRLKAAHIGIAMGGRGTDVAREASSIVLLDDDFGSIVKFVRLGRRIYDNLRKAMGFIFAVHVPIAGLALLPWIAARKLSKVADKQIDENDYRAAVDGHVLT
jgi:P-type Ca2+ transporter type 2C